MGTAALAGSEISQSKPTNVEQTDVADVIPLFAKPFLAPEMFSVAA